jgi:hypothetical protein
MTKHTPAPWKMVDAGPHYNNKAITNYQIQYGDDGECISDHVYEEADARLIAAAPELLDALKLAASVLSGDEMTKYSLVKALEKARDAISKAVAD